MPKPSTSAQHCKAKKTNKKDFFRAVTASKTIMNQECEAVVTASKLVCWRDNKVMFMSPNRNGSGFQIEDIAQGSEQDSGVDSDSCDTSFTRNMQTSTRSKAKKIRHSDEQLAPISMIDQPQHKLPRLETSIEQFRTMKSVRKLFSGKKSQHGIQLPNYNKNKYF